MAIDLEKLALNTARQEYLKQQIEMHEGYLNIFEEELSRALRDHERILTGEDVDV